MLRDAIAEADAKTGEAVARAKRLLAELPEQVLEAGTTGSLWCREEIDRNMADAARVKILDALMELRGASRQPE